MNLYHRFLSKVDVREVNECWPWLGAVSTYGSFRIRDGVTRSAHRMSYFIHHQRWPSLDLLHSCDNPLCVNPAHLSEGTAADNAADMVAKGRSGNRVLTDEQVREIKRRRRDGETPAVLATAFGVCSDTIYKIVTGRHHYARLA